MKKVIFGCVLIFVMIAVSAQSGAKFIVIDQFGYPPDAKKVAVIRDPQIGYDAEELFSPGTNYSVIEVSSGDPVYSGVVSRWNNGATDESSGDRAWHFDFSDLTETGTYYILDVERGQRSYEFEIAPNVYNEVLKHAVRTFYYQRVGYVKEAQYAGLEWADGASHVGDLQDLNCRSFFAKDDATTELDVSGGWYDAGDYNKYTSWTAGYVVDFMKAYLENPDAWSDDYNIPESGNGVPDLLDEAKWGIDHLMRLQLANGSVLSIVGEAHGSPPSSANGASYYGKVNTSGTLNTAAALALSSKVYRIIGQEIYADSLLSRAIRAFNWAEANPAIVFNNNDPAYSSSGLGAGRMETDDFGRLMSKLKAACFLYDVTGETSYRDFFDANYTKVHMIEWTFVFPYEMENQEMLLYYTSIPGASQTVKADIKNRYKSSMHNTAANFKAMNTVKDPYFAFLDSYTWGSNRTKASQGTMYSDLIHFDIDPAFNEEARQASLKYVNYIHGVNPLSFVYLSNMYKYGADNGVNEFYHSWFSNGSLKWDRFGESIYGPAPGFLTGGPNPSYDRDGCCPSGCGSASNNSVCSNESITPPKGQPKQKSYKDFNTSWPLNSWSVTENSCGYQIMYIRLLSNFVKAGMDCNGDIDGTAFMDSCGVCAGGNTGIIPKLDPDECMPDVDCNGELGGVAFLDSCGNCSGGETGLEPVMDIELCNDCNGDFNGTAYLDSCTICAEGETGREAVLTKEECYDCNNEFNGLAILDSCGICSGGSTGIEPVLTEAECYDCNGDFNGLAFIDSCGICADGNTGIVATLNPDECGPPDNVVSYSKNDLIKYYPNPSNETLTIESLTGKECKIELVDMQGSVVFKDIFIDKQQIKTNAFSAGYYQLIVTVSNKVIREKLLIL